MQIDFRCPRCDTQNRTELGNDGALTCAAGDWSRTVAAEDFAGNRPAHCLVCGCVDVWRQKDFSPRVGVTLVGLGILLSTIAWARMEPVWAIGILMVFALVDMLLYVFMSDVLVCYRCGTRHRYATLDDEHPRFNLETHERYRQEALRLEEAGQTPQ